MKRLYLALLVSLLALPAWGQDYDAGAAAYKRGDYATALEAWRPLAEQGDVHAQFDLGAMYDHGMGVPPNDAEAAKWYRLAAEQGHLDAQFSIGLAYVKGQGVRQDYSEAVRWFRMAADQGEPNAQVALGVMYDNGTGVPPNPSMAMRLYRLAAKQGNAVAQNNIGYSYQVGRSVSQDYVEAARWFRMAADQGDDDAQVSLGTMYAEGLGVEQNYDEAIRLYGLAAEQGNTVAQYHLAKEGERLSAKIKGDTKNQQIASLPPRTEQEKVLVRQVQEALAEIGYYDGSIDGIAGPVTRDGIVAFQQDAGVPVTGEVSKELAGQLELIIAVAIAQGSVEPREQVPDISELDTPIETPEKVSTGTGFFIDDEGRILTNRHVVQGCETVKVAHSGRTVTSDFIQTDTVQDLALIETDMQSRAVAFFRSGRGIRPGDSVYAYGFPLQGLLASDPGITAGNISNLAGIGDDRSLLQITAPIQSGNSGGPLLDKSGNVVGVVVGKLNSLVIAKLTGDIPQNVNFAINATEARKFLDIHGIAYRTAPSQQEMDAADIASSARRFTVLVECWR